MRTILLKFAGPLQAWGVDSHFNTRDTQRYPSKSAIVGLIAASLGYRRDEDEKIKKLNRLDFGVRIDQPGSILKDYHIARKYKLNGNFDQTYVTERFYLQDAIFIVAIGSIEHDWIEEILLGLTNPFFQPFMGRRSLPVNLDFILEVNDRSVMENLNVLDWQASEWYQKKGSKKLPVYADAHLLSYKNSILTRDTVLSFSQKERKHGLRAIATTFVDKNPKVCNEEHDAFGWLGG